MQQNSPSARTPFHFACFGLSGHFKTVVLGFSTQEPILLRMIKDVKNTFFFRSFFFRCFFYVFFVFAVDKNKKSLFLK